jgi:hypothetical protein
MKTSEAFKSKKEITLLPDTCAAKIQEASKVAISRCAGIHGQHENDCGAALYVLPSPALIASSSRRRSWVWMPSVAMPAIDFNAKSQNQRQAEASN